MQLLDSLKQKGYRLTKPRTEILKILNHLPLTVSEIQQQLKAKEINIDLASVYRSLELFTQMEIVKAIELGEGKKRYELVDENHHHHHIVCTNCGDIEDIEPNETILVEQINKTTKYKVKSHNLEFFGLCPGCQ